MVYEAITFSEFEQPDVTKWNKLNSNDAYFDTELDKFSREEVPSSVNKIKLKTAATGNPVEILPDGTDDNIDTVIRAKGTGVIKQAKRRFWAMLTGYDVTASVGDGIIYFYIPTELNGMNLTDAEVRCVTAGTTGVMTVQVHNVTGGVDMLSTPLTVDSTETSSETAATPAVIDTNNDDVVDGDLIRIDVDTVHTTRAEGVSIFLIFELP